MFLYFYDVIYGIYENGEQSIGGSLLIKNTTFMSPDGLKDYVRQYHNKPGAAVVFLKNERLTQELYLEKGGNLDLPSETLIED